MYAKHAWPTYIIVAIVYVRETRPAYTRAITNSLCTPIIVSINQRARPTPLAGPQTLLSHFIEQVQPEHGTTAARAAREQLLAQPPHSHLLSEPGPVRIGGH